MKTVSESHFAEKDLDIMIDTKDIKVRSDKQTNKYK